MDTYDTNSAISVNPDGHIALEGLNNTRDLGGKKTIEGQRIASKRLLRSGSLSAATDNDIAILSKDYHVDKVLDLRTDEERKARPDPSDRLVGATFVNIPLLDAATLHITRDVGDEDIAKTVEALAQDPVRLMVDIYPHMLLDKESQRGFGVFFEELLSENGGSVLWHCSAGKDRAGMCTVLLLTVLGIPHEDIVKDYLATNKYTQESTQEILSAMAAYGLKDGRLRESVQILNSADERFLNAALDTVDNEFGSLGAFLKEVVDVTDEKADFLRAKYLV